MIVIYVTDVMSIFGVTDVMSVLDLTDVRRDGHDAGVRQQAMRP